MVCERCHGTGYPAPRYVEVEGEAPRLVRDAQLPCPDCGGCGRLHCCDGLHEQPEEENMDVLIGSDRG